VFRRGPAPELIATIPVGDLPHGIWPSGDGSRVYVALENGVKAAVIDTLTNRVIANVPIGQTSQALVYVPNAVPAGDGTDNVVPLGEAGNTARLRLEAGAAITPGAHGWVAVNSLGLLDLVQIATEGLIPKSQYQVYLAESHQAPFGKLEPLAVLKTNPDGAGIVQTIGPQQIDGTQSDKGWASFAERVVPTHDRGLFSYQWRFKNFSYLIENMVARDGVEPPMPAFSGLYSLSLNHF
jgi:YVTN family beta-propeller protein